MARLSGKTHTGKLLSERPLVELALKGGKQSLNDSSNISSREWGGELQSDQELFARGLATYQKVVDLNYMAHKEVYDTLRGVLISEAPDNFVFLDLACGTAGSSARALKGTTVGRYIGVDISRPSLEIAREELKVLSCPIDLRCEDFVDAMATWRDPVDVAWIGQSLHHLPTQRELMRRIRATLSSNGMLLIWEPTCFDGENRDAWMVRFRRLRPQWDKVTDEEFAAFDSHCSVSDYSETSAVWQDVGRQAGFARVEELLIVPNRLARVFKYSQ